MTPMTDQEGKELSDCLDRILRLIVKHNLGVAKVELRSPSTRELLGIVVVATEKGLTEQLGAWTEALATDKLGKPNVFET